MHDAASDGDFTRDPYIVQHRPKSVLCAPIINQGRLTGILYLENNLTTGAFTEERLQVIQVLSSQVAISIENALLYQTLGQRVEERTRQLAEANREITHLNEQLKSENLRLVAELEVTRQIQQMLLPPRKNSSRSMGSISRAIWNPQMKSAVIITTFLQHNGQIKIGIGDVTGHGLESGVVMVMTQTVVRALLTIGETDPVRFLDALNRALYGNVQRMGTDKILTLSLIDYAHGEVKLSGQHEEMILVRQDGEVELVDTMDLGFPIALDDNIADFIHHTTVQLEPGDGIVLYTDGITEAENLAGEPYGLERLCAVVEGHWSYTAEAIKTAVVADVKRHMGDQEVYDDVTLVVVKQQ